MRSSGEGILRFIGSRGGEALEEESMVLCERFEVINPRREDVRGGGCGRAFKGGWYIIAWCLCLGLPRGPYTGSF